jgi:hypothetical protein
MTALVGWLAALLVVVLLIGVPLVLGRMLADRDRVLERDERSALEAEALTLMVGQPVDEVSSDDGSPPEEVSPLEEVVSPPEDDVSPADGQGSSPM